MRRPGPIPGLGFRPATAVYWHVGKATDNLIAACARPDPGVEREIAAARPPPRPAGGPAGRPANGHPTCDLTSTRHPWLAQAFGFPVLL